MPPAAHPLLKLAGIRKAFPGVQALDGVHLDLRAGEVHAVMGENGAGKSTLMKVIGGVHEPDEGSLEMDGKSVRFASPAAAQDAGIAVIYQELTVLENLDVGRNIMLGREPRHHGMLVDAPALYRQAQTALDDLGIALDVRAPAEGLSVGSRQMVEIARAASRDPRVLIMDEPTASLGKHEETALFALVKRLRARGVGVLYISHRLEEVFLLADRITILRDGRLIGTHPTPELTRGSLIAMMVGRELATVEFRSGPPGIDEQAPPALELRELHRGDAVRGVDLTVRGGEVVALAGLIGSGRTELARLAFGADRADSGEVLVQGRPVRASGPRGAIRAGIAYVPEDRKSLGLVLTQTVRLNLLLATLRRYRRRGFLSRPAAQRGAQELIERLRIRTPGPGAQVENLSGGNQQKVVVARWLATDPKVLILDEPTRGIDVGAKAEVHRLVREVAARGVGVLMISSELPEVLSVSDRIVVMHQGTVAGELAAEGATEEQVIALAFGPAPDAAEAA